MSFRGFRIEDRAFFVGLTGKGKTTLALYVIERMQPVRVVVFDPKGEFDFGFPPARTPEELAATMAQPIVHYVPASFDRKALEEACQIVWNTPGPYLWLIDEASEFTNPNYIPEGLRLCATQGRKLRKMLLALTQRVAETHPVLRSQAEHVVVFTPPPIDLDLKEIARAIRREAPLIEEELASLHEECGDFSHLWYVRPTDELRRCAPIPFTGDELRASPDSPGRAAPQEELKEAESPA